MQGRYDPFFSHRAPHKKSFLESMTRQYGKSTALPERDDGSYARAMEFRNKEKVRYGVMEQENERLRSEVVALTGRNAALNAETQKIKGLWEQLSKVSTRSHDEYQRDDATGSKRISPGAGGSNGSSGVVQSAKASTTRRVGVRNSGDKDTGKQETRGEAESVRREVLPADIPDTRGSTDEHSAEGSEPRSGVERRAEESVLADAVREDEE